MRAKPYTHGKISEIIQLYPNMCIGRNLEQQLYTNLTITLSLHDHRKITCAPRSPCGRGPLLILGKNIITLRNMRTQPYRRGHYDSGGLRLLSGDVVHFQLHITFKTVTIHFVHIMIEDSSTLLYDLYIYVLMYVYSNSHS